MSVPTPQSVSQDALFILKNLRDNGKAGRSNKLAEVKEALEPAVALEFDTYFFFLRKFHYISMDREAHVRLTDAAEVVLGGDRSRFDEEVEDFFAPQLGSDLEDDERTHVLGMEDPLRAAAEALPFDPGHDLDEVSDATGPIHLPPELAEATLSAVTPGPSRKSEIPMASPSSAPPSIAPVAPPAPKGVELDGRYQRFEPVGMGPLGTVYDGRQGALGTSVAIKEFKDIFGYFSFLQRGAVLGRLRNELCAQAAIRHPGVVAVLDQNVEAPRPYFVTERLESNLREKLTDAGEAGLDVRWALRAFLQAAYGLRAAHAAGLTHHNLKPENLLLDAAGNVKLSDFGLGRIIEVDAGKNLPQVFLGTGGMAYLAPELLGREQDADVPADVYGLGIILYEMLTGQIPGRRSPLPSEVNRNVPAGLDAIFDRMTHDRRDQRYPDLDAMLEEFYGVFPSGEHLGRGELIIAS